MVSHSFSQQFLISPRARVSCRHRQNRRNDRVSRRKYRSTHLPPPSPFDHVARSKSTICTRPPLSLPPSTIQSSNEQRKETIREEFLLEIFFFFRKFTHPFPPFKTHTKVLLIFRSSSSSRQSHSQSSSFNVNSSSLLPPNRSSRTFSLLPSRPSSILSFRSPRSESSSSSCGATRMEHGRRGTGAPPRCEKLCD